MDKIKRDLIEKYSKNSKHSQYQILSNNLRKVVGGRGINTKTRFERERLDYILKKQREHKRQIKEGIDDIKNIEFRELPDPAGDAGDTLIFFVESRKKSTH